MSREVLVSARFAEVMGDFAKRLRELGPPAEETTDLPGKLAVLSGLVPWVKLVEREKLRVPTRSVSGWPFPRIRRGLSKARRSVPTPGPDG